MTVTVLVPTYRRPRDLARCLGALAAQAAPAEEIVVVARPDDEETQAVVASFELPALRVVPVRKPGQVEALNAGLAAATSDIVAITDDDAAPHPDWVARIRMHFAADPQLGGLGGRDWVHQPDGRLESHEKKTVGVLQWFGRTIGNHHLGTGPAREVEVLKGANMSYRREALAAVGFDSRLWGAGAQVCNDMAVSLGVRRDGWKVVYDPAVAVDHFPGVRLDADGRSRRSLASVRNHSFNETLVVLEHQRAEHGAGRALLALAYSLLVGTRPLPGLLQAFRLFASGRTSDAATLAPVLQGRWAATRALVREALPPVIPRASVDVE